MGSESSLTRFVYWGEVESDSQKCELVLPTSWSVPVFPLQSKQVCLLPLQTQVLHTNKQSVLLPFHPPPRALLNNHTVFLSQDLWGHLAPKGWVPVPGHVQGGWLVAHPHRGRLRAPSTWQGKSGARLTSRLPSQQFPVPCHRSECSPVHRSLDALVPCEGQSLLPEGRNTVSRAHEPWRRSGWGVEPEARLG